MNALYLYFHGTNQVTLSGEGSSSVLKGCKYWPEKGIIEQGELGELVRESIDIRMEGAPGSIDSKIKAISQLVELAGCEPVEQDFVYLRYYDAGAGVDWKSRLVSGKVTLAGAGLAERDGGSQVIKLSITRLNYWAAPKKILNGYTAGVAEPTEIAASYSLESHQDGDTSNTAYVDGDFLDGDLPSPIEVRMSMASGNFNQLTLCMRTFKDQYRGQDVGYVEAEGLTAGAGVTLVNTVAAAASAGHFARLTWTSASEVLLLKYSIPAADMKYYRGLLHKAIMRLGNTHAYTDLSFKAKLFISGTSIVIAESLSVVSAASSLYQEVPPLGIPPSLAGFGAYASVDYCIYGLKADGAAATLDVDFFYLAPAEVIRKLVPIDTAVSGADRYLIDSGIDGKLYLLDASNQANFTHVGSGAWLVAVPGYHHAVRVFHTYSGVGTFNLHQVMTVALWYEPRRRVL